MGELTLLILEKVCEAIYFSLFLILGKNIKEKKLLFISIMIIEYLMITEVIQYSIWIHISYIIMTYINLKVLYKEKAQITDIFLFMFASMILIIICIFSYFVLQGWKDFLHYVFSLMLSRALMIIVFLILRKYIQPIYKKFYDLWNKRKNSKIRSLTVRNISIILFNIMFYILNLVLGLYLIIGRR